MKEKMPAVNVSMLDGQLAWRQHDGGHTDGPNWKHFIPWADRIWRERGRTTPVAHRHQAAFAATRPASQALHAHSALSPAAAR